ncbi:LysR family transcriptional regulator [Muricoccus aerilatus]|uniref:LysR family transcriptional regulator n=1 Tax=Muricoccus aerilatus TaxID=452982 RepID=UPI0006948A80|nr:LysR substrate-binding domain-containing protein [Roseomonas aerilata]
MNDLRRVDLNLLVVLDTLLEEAHVTRAARRLGLSQPAASNALERLRHLFDDPLLEREGGRLRPTPRAEALRTPLRDALGAMRGVLQLPPPSLGNARRVVRILIADAPATALVAKLRAALAVTAPGVTPALLPWAGASDALTRLSRAEADLVASILPVVEPPLRQRALLEEHYLVVMRRGHPAAAEFDLARWLAFPHVVVSGHGATETALDTVLARRGLSRRVGVVVPSFLMVLPLLAGSDLIAALPSRCIPADPSLAVRNPPLRMEGFRLDLAWHDRSGNDPVVTHVADTIGALLSEEGAENPIALTQE